MGRKYHIPHISGLVFRKGTQSFIVKDIKTDLGGVFVHRYIPTAMLYLSTVMFNISCPLTSRNIDIAETLFLHDMAYIWVSTAEVTKDLFNA